MNDLHRLTTNTHWYPQAPASRTALGTLIATCGVTLPDEYVSFLAFSNGGAGELGVEPGWFSLWPAEEVVTLNQAYGIPEWLPGFFGFGSNGGGELLAFDTRNLPPWKVVMVPFIVLDEKEAVIVTNQFATFVNAIGRRLES